MSVLGLSTLMLVTGAMAGAYGLGALARANQRDRRTIMIEVGVQNAAQAIALASSPLVFGDSVIAIPAIVYALTMNVVMLLYVAIVRWWKS